MIYDNGGSSGKVHKLMVYAIFTIQKETFCMVKLCVVNDTKKQKRFSLLFP